MTASDKRVVASAVIVFLFLPLAVSLLRFVAGLSHGMSWAVAMVLTVSLCNELHHWIRAARK